MKNLVNIAIIGLGQIGIYLYNELRSKKKEIERKTGKKINIVAISAKNRNKKLFVQKSRVTKKKKSEKICTRSLSYLTLTCNVAGSGSVWKGPVSSGRRLFFLTEIIFSTDDPC